MERCTDNRSTTPPLETMPIASKLNVNGKQKFPLSLYDKEDLADISQSIPMSSSEDALYVSSTPPRPPSPASKSSVLCNYASTLKEYSEVTRSNSKPKSDRCKSIKSLVINRKAEEQDRKQRRERRRSGSKKRDESSKDVPKELPKNREIRRTVTEPAIEYCENGRYSSNWKNQTYLEANPKERVSEQSSKNTTETCSKSPRVKIEEPKNECSPPCKKMKKSSNDCFRSSTEDTRLIETKLSKQLVSNDMFSCETNDLPSNIRESVSIEQKSLIQEQSIVSDIRIASKNNSPSHESSDNMDVTSTTPETPKTPLIESKKLIEPKLSEDKMKQYIDEYDSFIQQVSSPPNETLKTSEKNENIVVANVESMKSSIAQPNDSVSKRDLPKNEVSSSTSSAQKINQKSDVQHSTSSSSSDDDDSSTSSNSSSSSSSDDDDSSSSSSGSSSSSSSDSNDNDLPRRQRRKSSSKSSSRSASKSPRIRPWKPSNIDVSKPYYSEMDDLVFAVSENNKTSYTNGIEALINPMSFVKGMDMSALKSLDALINGDDEDDLLSNIQSYKNNYLEVIKGKKHYSAAKKSKFDEISSNDSSINNSTRDYKNGVLLDDSERKKISLKLKPTTTLKQQAKGMSESFLEIEQQSLIHTQTSIPSPQLQPEQQKTSPEEQLQQSQTKSQKAAEIEKQASNEHNDQIEKRSSDGSMTSSSKRKSSHRRDERKSRRSEDRKSHRSGERSRSRRDENRRSRRSEERKTEKYSKRGEERRSRRSEEHRSKRSDDRPSRRSEEKRSRRSEERRSKRRYDRSPSGSIHYRESYYSPSYRNRSPSPLPRGPRTPPNTPPPNTTEFDQFRIDDMAMRQHIPPYGTPIMSPATHYHPGPNQFQTPNLTSNAPPSYIHDYTAYMHPNVPIPAQQHYNRPPPSLNVSALIPPLGMISQNNEYYYSAPPPPHHHLQNQSITPNSYSNLIEVSPHSVPNTSNVDCIRKQQTDNHRRKPTIAVQKGNVLEIVPSAELQCDKNNESNNIEKSDKMLSIRKQALQRQKQDRYKRKMERHQKRLERTKRKEYLLNELARLSHCMTFASDNKVVKASELLKAITFDGTTIKLANSKDDDENEDLEDIYIEPPVHSYDPQAPIGRSILSERNDPDGAPASKEKRRSVLFADGVAPGEGTSASEESANENDDNIIKPKKLSSRVKDKINIKNVTLPPFSNESTPTFLEKGNSFETTKRESGSNEQVVPPPPPGSPPPHLPQPKLKDPNKFMSNHLLFFQYDLRRNEMLITQPHMMPMMKPPIVLNTPTVIPQLPPQPVQQMLPLYPYKSNSSRHHNESKTSKSSRSSSSKHYHSSSSSSSSSHKAMHTMSHETNLIVLSSSPSNV